MHRLVVQIYLGFVAVVVVFALLVAAGWHLLRSDRNDLRALSSAGMLLGEALPAPGAPVPDLQATLDRLHEELALDLVVLDEDRSPIASAGTRFRMPPPHRLHHGWTRRDRGGWKVALALPDGRWVVARHDRHGGRWLWVLPALALAIALVAWPLARRISGRLERLRTQVDAFGEGDLDARVDVRGRDEVAQLAASFNRAAARIEELVTTKRHVLASASHELRSPLTRIRMALELAEPTLRPDLRERVSADLAELEDLIEELLLSSRLEALGDGERGEAVDLLALAAEEGSRVGAQVDGERCEVRASPRMVRRALRNLLENARRHARERVTVTVAVKKASAIVRVADDGPGVPDGERDRIFEPFYRPSGIREGEGSGVGLGLALVRQIAEGLGGNVRLGTGAGHGASFELELPLAGAAGNAE